MKNSKDVWVSVVVGIVIVLGVWWFWSRARTAPTELPTEEPIAQSEEQTEEDEVLPSEVAVNVAVADQKAGTGVLVSYTLPVASWVAVHEAAGEAAGTPEKLGKILGARLFAPGAGSGTVALLRATETGKTYAAVIHRSVLAGASNIASRSALTK